MSEQDSLDLMINRIKAELKPFERTQSLEAVEYLNTMSEQDFNVKKGINELILNLNEFKTGMYLIRYSSGGSYQSAEKLIIVK